MTTLWDSSNTDEQVTSLSLVKEDYSDNDDMSQWPQHENTQ